MLPIFRARNAALRNFKTPFSFDIAGDAKAAVYGPRKWDLLEIIGGRVPDPARNISFPGIGQELWPSQAIELTKFGQGTASNSKAPFIGARYESYRDEFDVSLRSVLQSKAPSGTSAQEVMQIAEKLDLSQFLDNWWVGLSNGQSRRAQLALALLRKPRLLIMDEPFLGLDPKNRAKFGSILSQLETPVVIGLRSGESAPDWVSQYLFASETGVATGQAALDPIAESGEATLSMMSRRAARQASRETTAKGTGTPVIELKNLTIKFPNADRPLFQDINVTVCMGERLHVSGPNGSGKSTLLALITADHPQCWSSDVSIFGERLKVGKHSYFSINKHIGHSSPELHAIFPKSLTARRAISTGFSSNMYPPAQLSPEQDQRLSQIAERLNIKLDSTPFGELTSDQQKLVLFARALVKSPRILILDEAFSTLSSSQIETAFEVLDEFDGAVLVVGHVEQEIPVCDQKLVLK